LGTKSITVATTIVKALNLYCYLKAFSRNCLLLGKLYGKTVAGNVVISEVDALPWGRSKQGRKTRASWGISSEHRTYNAIDDASHQPKSL